MLRVASSLDVLLPTYNKSSSCGTLRIRPRCFDAHVSRTLPYAEGVTVGDLTLEDFIALKEKDHVSRQHDRSSMLRLLLVLHESDTRSSYYAAERTRRQHYHVQ